MDLITITRQQFDQAFQQADSKYYGIQAIVENMGPRETLWKLLVDIAGNVANEPD